MNDKTIKVYIVGGNTSYTGLFLDKIEVVDDIQSANIVLFTGGEDIYPAIYEEDTGKYTSYNKARDDSERKMFYEARQYNKFILGICRGSQLITALSGGSLIQHVSNHGISGTHKIHLMNENVDIDITSTHHQMMYPFYMDKSKYQILAKSMVDLSTTYLDGNDNERSLPNDFVEPEIVYYNQTNALCIQGHPEYMPKNSSAVRYINVLIREYLEDTVETVPEELEDEDIPNMDDGILRMVENVDINYMHIDQIRAQLDNALRGMAQANVQAPRPERAFNAVWNIDDMDFH